MYMMQFREGFQTIADHPLSLPYRWRFGREDHLDLVFSTRWPCGYVVSPLLIHSYGETNVLDRLANNLETEITIEI